MFVKFKPLVMGEGVASLTESLKDLPSGPELCSCLTSCEPALLSRLSSLISAVLHESKEVGHKSGIF